MQPLQVRIWKMDRSKRLASDELCVPGHSIKRMRMDHSDLPMVHCTVLLPRHLLSVLQVAQSKQACRLLVNFFERAAAANQFLANAPPVWSQRVSFQFESSNCFLRHTFSSTVNQPLVVDTTRPPMSSPWNSESGERYVRRLASNRFSEIAKYTEFHQDRLGRAFSRFCSLDELQLDQQTLSLYSGSIEFIKRLCPVALVVNRDWPRLVQRISVDPFCMNERSAWSVADFIRQDSY